MQLSGHLVGPSSCAILVAANLLLPIYMSKDKTFSRWELLRAAAYALVLFGINAYVCRDLFTNTTAYMNSMHGFWIALAKRIGSNWWYSNWWPYWDCGLLFEFSYTQ